METIPLTHSWRALQDGWETTTLAYLMYSEMREQPEAMARAVRESAEGVRALVREAKARDTRYIVLAARGTSDNAATYAKYLIQTVIGIPVALAAPSVQTLYEAEVDYRGALVIGVSQSGAGEDIAAVVAQARRSGALTAAITNTDGSLLTRTAEHVLLCQAGVEKAVAATKTYTTTLAIFAQIVAEWSQNSILIDGLAQIKTAAERALEAETRVETISKTLWHAERLITVGRGLNLSTALESALKIAETTYTPTQAFSSADLLHGPIASVAMNTASLLFLPKGRTAAGTEEVAQTLTARGARVLRFVPDAVGPYDIPLADPGTEWLSPLVDIIPAQLLAYHLSLTRGIDVDNPKGLSKVTITR